MTRAKFVQQYLNPSTASTVATRKPSQQDIRRSTGSTQVDYRVEQATAKE